MRCARTCIGAGLLAFSTLAWTQPVETVLHRGPAMGGPRLIGLGGAFAGMGDDANTIVANPAGLFAIPRSLDGGLAMGNTDGEPFFTAVAFHLNSRFSTGLYASGLESRRRVIRSVPPEAPPQPAIEALFTGAAGREWAYGAGMAVRIRRRFAVGGGFGLHHLNFRPDEEGRSDKAFGYTAGIFFRPDQMHGARAGVVFQSARTWSPNATGRVADPVEVRTPSIWSAGISWRYDGWWGGRVVYMLQPDWVRYSELRLSTGQRGNDDLDLSAGVEASYPLARGKCFSGCGDMIQLRVGVVSRSAGPAVVQLGRRTSWTAGAGWAPHWALPIGKFRIDAGYRHETRAFSLGIGIRYPESYRAELETTR